MVKEKNRFTVSLLSLAMAGTMLTTTPVFAATDDASEAQNKPTAAEQKVLDESSKVTDEEADQSVEDALSDPERQDDPLYWTIEHPEANEDKDEDKNVEDDTTEEDSEQQDEEQESKDTESSDSAKASSPIFRLFGMSLMSKAPAKNSAKMEKKVSSKQKGIDVSYYNGQINWSKVKAAGIKFAIVRVGYRTYGNGAMYPDSTMARNIQGAHAAGLKVGAYMFSQAITPNEAKGEANYMISKLKPYKKMIDLPIVMDYEYAGSNGRLKAARLSKTAATNCVLAFNKAAKAGGYTPMIYGSTAFLNGQLNMSKINVPVWVAQYNSVCNYTGKKEMWQYSSSGNVNGIGGRVDMNWWYTSDLNKFKQEDFTGKANVKFGTVSKNSVELSWDKVSGATKYDIARKEAGDSKYQYLVKGQTANEYVDTTVKPQKTYSYKVLSYKGSDKGKWSSVIKTTTPEDFQETTEITTSKVRSAQDLYLKWDKAPTASSYRVTITPVNDTAKKVTPLETKETSVTLNDMGYGNTYKITVTPLKGSAEGVASKAVTLTTDKELTGIVKNVRVSSSDTDGATIKWDKLANAKEYIVEASNKKTSGYTEVRQTAGTTFNDSRIQRGEAEYIRVKAVSGSQETAYSDPLLVKTDFPYTVKDSSERSVAYYVGSTYYHADGSAVSGTVTKTGASNGKWNLRKSAPSGKVIVQLKKGDKATIKSEKIASSGSWWYKVRVKHNNKNYTGWVYGPGIV